MVVALLSMFHGISTLVGYLMSISLSIYIYIYIYMIWESSLLGAFLNEPELIRLHIVKCLVGCLGFMAYHPLKVI